MNRRSFKTESIVYRKWARKTTDLALAKPLWTDSSWWISKIWQQIFRHRGYRIRSRQNRLNRSRRVWWFFARRIFKKHVPTPHERSRGFKGCGTRDKIPEWEKQDANLVSIQVHLITSRVSKRRVPQGIRWVKAHQLVQTSWSNLVLRRQGCANPRVCCRDAADTRVCGKKVVTPFCQRSWWLKNQPRVNLEKTTGGDGNPIRARRVTFGWIGGQIWSLRSAKLVQPHKPNDRLLVGLRIKLKAWRLGREIRFWERA